MAFGLGLERIAMVLFAIPDIRLFWSQDPRFLSQFAPQKAPTRYNSWRACWCVRSGGVRAGKEAARHHVQAVQQIPCLLQGRLLLAASNFHENDLFEIIRDVAGDLTEDVVKIDDFTHPTTQKRSNATGSTTGVWTGIWKTKRSTRCMVS
ncbi:hypothetical protein L7F22_044555 [Adiantum nelumboides]|nr:hypothetical protein [Adiantum nelumboides]